jgi:hypothetical protein
MATKRNPSGEPGLYLDPTKPTDLHADAYLEHRLRAEENNHVKSLSNDPFDYYTRRWLFKPQMSLQAIIYKLRVLEEITKIFRESRMGFDKPIYLSCVVQWVVVARKGEDRGMAFDSLPPEEGINRDDMRNIYDEAFMEDARTLKSSSCEYKVLYQATVDDLVKRKDYRLMCVYSTFPRLQSLQETLNKMQFDPKQIQLAKTMLRICQEIVDTVSRLHRNRIVHGTIDHTSFGAAEEDGELHAYLSSFKSAVKYQWEDVRVMQDFDSMKFRMAIAYDIACTMRLLTDIYNFTANNLYRLNLEALSIVAQWHEFIGLYEIGQMNANMTQIAAYMNWDVVYRAITISFAHLMNKIEAENGGNNNNNANNQRRTRLRRS